MLKKKTEVSRWQKRPSGTGLHGCQFPGLSLKVLNTIFFFESKYWLGKGGTAPLPPTHTLHLPNSNVAQLELSHNTGF